MIVRSSFWRYQIIRSLASLKNLVPFSQLRLTLLGVREVIQTQPVLYEKLV